MNRQVLMKARVLFLIENCVFCREYKKFIEEVNMNLPPNKRINVIYCDEYYDYGLILDPMIRVFKKYLTGQFPVLFFEGCVLQGAVEREILEYFVKSLVSDDMILQERNPFYFSENCKVIEGRFVGRKILCE